MVNTLFFIGLLSAYSLNPTVATIEYNQNLGRLPPGNIDDNYIMMAVNDCGLVGETGTLFIDGERQEEHVLVFDCLGGSGIHSWMSASNEDTPYKVSGELGWFDWVAHPDWVHSGKMAVIWFGEEYGEQH